MDGMTTERLIAGRYRLDSVLGRGGMGVVWAAHDDLLGRPVAVKEVLPVAGLRPDDLAVMRRRTMAEARNAARLASGASVLVYDVVEDDGEPWIVMERLAPRTLDDVLRERGVLATHEVAELGRRLLDALDAAHAVAVLHRDVKPSNVMFRGAEQMGNAVLTDFGVARFTGDPAATATGTLIGSPAFVAPERASGGPASPASDLWALGVTLWIAAEGVSPFHREGTLATLSAVLTADPPPLQLAGPLAPVLSGLLDKDPDRRLTAAEARQLLERIHGPRARQVRPLDTTAAVAATGAATPTEAPPAAQAPPTPIAPVAAAAPAVSVPAAAPDDEPGDPVVATPRRGRSRLLAAGAVAVAAVGVAAAAQLLDGSTPRDGVASPGAAATASAPASPQRTTASQPAATGSSTARATSVAGVASAPSATSTASVTSVPIATDPASATDPATSASGTSARSSGPASASAPTGSPTSGAAGRPAEGAVPAGTRRYTDSTGFSIAVPKDWTAERRSGRVYLRDPASSAYLLVDQTTTPAADPVADWQRQEKRVSKRLRGYRLVRIDPERFGQWEGADWEFTHGSSTHVLNRNLVTGPDQAYALYWSVPDSAWDRELGLFAQITASFRPRG